MEAASASFINGASSIVLNIDQAGKDGKVGQSTVTVVKVPALGLYIISDANNLGPHWVRVHCRKNVYTTHYLLGGDEETICPAARFLAENLFGECLCF